MTERSPPEPEKQPPPCPHCGSSNTALKATRARKFGTSSVYRCRACGKRFTPGSRGTRGKTYPINEILEALTAYNRGYSLEEVSRRLSARYGHKVNPSTISRWLATHEHIATYRRLREKGRELFTPPQIIRTTKLYHAQVYEYGYHRAKLALLREGALDDRRAGQKKFAPLANFLENIPKACPHDLFKRDDGLRASRLSRDFLNLDKIVVTEKTNTATDIAALIIPSAGSNRQRHPKLQRYMLANDSVTVAVEVPIWLAEEDIAAVEDKYGITFAPKGATGADEPGTANSSRFITGHIDFLQVRNGAVHILDYKPDARTNKPFAQLTIYALALTRLVPGLRLFDIKCAWFNENCYCEFFPRLILPRPAKSPAKKS